MKNFTSEVINLKSYSLSEDDKIVLGYSKENGLIKYVAKGAKRQKSKFRANTQLLIANKMFFQTGRNFSILNQAKIIDSFYNIWTNFDKYTYSMYLSEIITYSTVEEEQNSNEIYNLLYQALKQIERSKNKTQILIAVLRFQIKFINLSGFLFELNNCVNCSCGVICETLNLYLTLGGILCDNCSKNSYGDIIKIHVKIKEFILALLNSNFNDSTYYDKNANEKVCIYTYNLLKTYLEIHLDRKFKTSKIIEGFENANK